MAQQHSTSQHNPLLEQSQKAATRKDYDEAIACALKLLQKEPYDPVALAHLGYLYTLTSRISLAKEVYEKGRINYPNDPVFLNGLGICFNADGNFARALDYYTQAHELSPDDAMFLYNIAGLKDCGPDHPITKRCIKLYEAEATPLEDRIFLCYALGKIYERLKEFDRAGFYYNEANRTQLLKKPLDAAKYATALERIENWFSADLIASMQSRVHGSFTPIFVLGMPRSGTSLVEQVLSSHADVHGAGEVDILAYVAERVIPKLTKQFYPEAIYNLSQDILDKLAWTYLEKLATYNTGRLFVVDKTPLNFLFIGIIAILFPNAPIVHCRRDPMDNCWSLYKHYFQGTAYSYRFEQRMLGRYYRGYQKLMQHWHTILPHRIHDVQYEALLDNPEAIIRSLLEYCKLPWDESCMEFHKTKRVVATASAAQVRQKIYKTSVQSWLPFKEHLIPLRSELGV